MNDKKKWLEKKLAEKVIELKHKEYEYFLSLIDKEPLIFSHGNINNDEFYQIEINVFFEDKNKKDILVTLSIDDGGWRAICPVSTNILISKAE
ncbi:MAG: hypothetical protein AAFO09_01375 [Pseudomonadota bacterium]